jgi:chromosome partitioning protein
VHDASRHFKIANRCAEKYSGTLPDRPASPVAGTIQATDTTITAGAPRTVKERARALEDPTLIDLPAALRTVVALPRPTGTITTAVLNPKSGTGKTTTAVNLAAALVTLKRKVLLIDLDPQAQASIHLGIQPRHAGRTANELLINGDLLPDSFVLSVGDLCLIPSNLRLAGSERELLNRLSGEEILRRRIRPLLGHFDHVFLDCPPSLGMLSLNALFAADEVIIPISADLSALEGLRALLATLELLNRDSGKRVAIGGVVLTRYDWRRAVAAGAQDTARRSRLPVFRTVIRENAHLQEAPGRGLDIFRYAPQARGAEDYLNLAKEWVGA